MTPSTSAGVLSVAVAVVAVVAIVAVARELDPAACAARFDVQRDKIIRTEESREMGARYLSELDVGSRAECRRLCCETDACDVFVYEEKSPGSCYLFKCGPPEDFRCKFTAHGNFSSGVLALSRRLAELQDQERLAPPPPPPPPPLTPAPTAAHTPHTPPAVPSPHHPRVVVTAPPVPPTAPPSPQPQSTRCSRYQWECHTGGECIAVYNACDGVPQCADGSDEAPELGCPALPPPPTPPPRATPPPPPPPPPPRAHQPVYPVQMFASEPGAGVVAGAGADEGGGERWPHRLLQAQPGRYPAAEGAGAGAGDEGPHIFSHKGGLVQEEPLPALEPPPPPGPALPWPRRPSWVNHQAAAAGGEEPGAWAAWGREWPAAPPPPPRVAPAPLPPREMDAYGGLPVLAGGGTAPEMPLMYPQPHALHDAPKKGPRPDTRGPRPDAAPTPAPASAPAPHTDNTTKKKAAAVQNDPKESSASRGAGAGAAGVAGAGAVVGAVTGAHTADEHDGLSEHPPAAILLLVLGVCMTGATGVVVGCRARSARWRRRGGGGKPYAHDADYLVNGMYL